MPSKEDFYSKLKQTVEDNQLRFRLDGEKIREIDTGRSPLIVMQCYGNINLNWIDAISISDASDYQWYVETEDRNALLKACGLETAR